MSHRDDLEERDEARARLDDAPARTPERRGSRRRRAVIAGASIAALAAAAAVAAGWFVLGAPWWRGRTSTEAGGHPPVACEPEEVRQARIARDEARTRALPRLSGPTRAEPGPLVQELGGIGAAPIAGAEQGIAALREATTMEVTIRTEDPHAISAIEVAVGRIDMTWGGTCDPTDDPCSCYRAGDDRDLCEALQRQLVAAWGNLDSDGRDSIWVDPTGTRRASLSAFQACRLTFETASDATSAIAMTAAAIIPLGAIGEPTSSVATALTWTRPGIGSGIGRTRLRAVAERDRVTGLEAKGWVTRATLRAILGRLVQLLGKPEAELGPYNRGTIHVWRRKVPVTLYADWGEDDGPDDARGYDYVIGVGAVAAQALRDRAR